MNLEHLRYFLVLSKYEHYGRAAEALCISQPGLSHAIAALETELGVKLFFKTGRNIKLTQYGEMLRQNVDKIIILVDECENLFLCVHTGGGILRIAGVINLMGMMVPRLVRGFKEKMDSPGEFKFFAESTKEIVEGVRTRKYDIGFCSRADWKNDIEAKPFQKQEMAAIMEPEHPLAKKKAVTLEETLSYPQIVFSETSALRPIMEEFFGQIGRKPRVAYEIERDEVIAEMAACGFGLAVMPKLASVYRSDLAVVPITSPSWENVFYIIRRKDDCFTLLEQKFYRYCMECAVLGSAEGNTF